MIVWIALRQDEQASKLPPRAEHIFYNVDPVSPSDDATNRLWNNRPVTDQYDVVVVGAGNAAFCAAHAARERVERVLMLEKAPREWVGGNTYFTAGAFRIDLPRPGRPAPAARPRRRRGGPDRPAALHRRTTSGPTCGA